MGEMEAKKEYGKLKVRRENGNMVKEKKGLNGVNNNGIEDVFINH